ncbi:hypothetical protein HY338_00025 [Candidatus Gottesmanbacteria bacterium]|nr:hypothetical protein [Candidatus Gottesmanbacteria bacterium]
MTLNRKMVIFISLLLAGILLWIAMFLIYSSIIGNKTPIIALPTLTPYPKISPFPTFQVKKTPTPGVKITATLSPTSGTENGYMEVSGVKIKDITKVALDTNKNGDLKLADNDRYLISFLKKFNIFIITVNSPPFDQVSREAENFFITTLGIPKEDACRLTVYVNMTERVDPKKAGLNYNLSWCRD